MNMPVPSFGMVYLISLPFAFAQTATASQPMALTATSLRAKASAMSP